MCDPKEPDDPGEAEHPPPHWGDGREGRAPSRLPGESGLASGLQS